MVCLCFLHQFDMDTNWFFACFLSVFEASPSSKGSLAALPGLYPTGQLPTVMVITDLNAFCICHPATLRLMLLEKQWGRRGREGGGSTFRGTFHRKLFISSIYTYISFWHWKCYLFMWYIGERWMEGLEIIWKYCS